MIVQYDHIDRYDDQLWTKDGAETVQQGRARFLPIDFFKDIPVKGCDYYYIRQIMYVFLYKSYRNLLNVLRC